MMRDISALQPKQRSAKVHIVANETYSLIVRNAVWYEAQRRKGKGGVSRRVNWLAAASWPPPARRSSVSIPPEVSLVCAVIELPDDPTCPER